MNYLKESKRTIERWSNKLKQGNRVKFVGTPKTGGYRAKE